MRRLAVVAMTALGVCAQAPLTMSDAVDSAVRNYPSVRVSQEQINAAAAGIQLARTAYLPRVDAMAQVNRATRNNVFGMLLPQSVIPSISGPVLGTNNFGTAWGSAMGVLVTWEPFDFGLRKASVDASRGGARRVGSGSQEDPVRCVGGGCRCLRYVGRGAGDGAGGASRSGSSRGDRADDSCAGERAVAARSGRIAGGCGVGGCANVADSGAAGGGNRARERVAIRGIAAGADRGRFGQAASVAAGGDRGAVGYGRESRGGANRTPWSSN